MVIWNSGFMVVWVYFEPEFHRTEYARWWHWAANDRPSCWSICLIFFVNNVDISLVWLCEETIWKAHGWGETSTCLASVGTEFITFWGGGLINEKNSNTYKKQSKKKLVQCPHKLLKFKKLPKYTSRCPKSVNFNAFSNLKIAQGGFWIISLKKTLISR